MDTDSAKIGTVRYGSEAEIIALTRRPTGMRIEPVADRRLPRGHLSRGLRALGIDLLFAKLKVFSRILPREDFPSSKIYVTAVTSAFAENCR